MKVRINLLIILVIMLIMYINKLDTYFLVLLFTLFHEFAHMLAGICFGFKIDSLDFLICGFSINFKNKINEYNKKVLKGNMNNIERIGIAFAGPIFNLIVVILLLNINFNSYSSFIYNIVENMIYINLMLAIFNLIPIYPLDGYIILSNILGLIIGNIKSKRYIHYISNIIMFIIAVLASIFILKYKNIWILIVLVVLYYLNIMENKKYYSKKRIYERYKK